MAPGPEQGNEPKAPDKNSEKSVNNSLGDEVKLKVDTSENLEANNQANIPDQNTLNNTTDTVADSGQFHDLDEGQLKALLDEALAYKNPKDRESKSVLFKELLQEAEADESDCSDETAAAAVAGSSSSGGNRHSATSRFGITRKRHGRKDVGVAERQRSGGSLQNLVHAIRGTGGRPHRDHVSGSVSARQREGGSLPTNVNVQGVDTDDVTHSSELVYNYTSRATLQVTQEPHHVDMAVSFPLTSKQATSSINGFETSPLQMHSSYNSVKCVLGSTNETKNPNRIPLPKDGPIEKKAVDENGNAVAGAANTKVDTVTSDRKGKRRTKMKNDKNTIIRTAETIEGHRGEENIETLLEYIESPSNHEHCKGTKSRQTNGPVNLVHKGARNVNKMKLKEEDASATVKGSNKRRNKETKLQKSNSLEEISKTKLEDLTSPCKSLENRLPPKKQTTLDDDQLTMMTSLDRVEPLKVETVHLSDGEGNLLDKKTDYLTDSTPGNEFHLVQKKQRRRKRQVAVTSRNNSNKVNSSGYYGTRGFSTHDKMERDSRSLYRYRHNPGVEENVHPRRKSASSVPPSDNSDCSDEGSVCSLPVSSTTPRPNVGKTSTSGGSTPQASYADIARSVASPPRSAYAGPESRLRRSTPASTVPSSAASSGIGDEEPSASPEPIIFKKDAMTDTNLDSFLPIEEYPPLKGPCNELFVEYTLKRRSNRELSVNVEETVILKTSTIDKSKPDNCSVVNEGPWSTRTCVSTKRPPVILLDEGRSSHNVGDLTFGFEVNQQLLTDECTHATHTAIAADHAKLVNYISSAWEEVMNEFHNSSDADSSASKIQYYSGQ